MFSRLLALAAVVAVAAALPADKPKLPRPITTISESDFDDGWFGFPMFSNFFAPIWRLFPTFSDFGPKIIADDDKFQVVVNVKDYKKEDLKVKVKSDFIFVEGSHQAKHEDHDLFASQFFHTYSLPANTSSSDVTAELSSDGFLIVTAPCNKEGSEKTEKVDREVPITETGVAYKTDKGDKPELIDDEDRKEPTTPPTDRDNVSIKDNDIPHGTEVPL